MKAVKINKTDTCLTYVLKRLGKFKKSKNYSLSNYQELFDSEKCENKEQLKVGDIVFWNQKMSYERYPIEITKDGMVISHEVQRHVHVGIIESIENEMILFSECTRTAMENAGIPILRIRDINEIRIPDYILRMKD